MGKISNSLGGGLSISFDNSRFTMTASQETEIIPASGESDTGSIIIESNGQSGDTFELSADSGSSYIARFIYTATTDFNGNGRPADFNGIGNSIGRYKVVTSSTAATRTYVRCITTWS